MITILILDDHPALRAGLTAVLRSQQGFAPLEAVASVHELWPALQRTRPDVLVLDYHLPDKDGLTVCRRVKREVPAPAVLLYSAYADASLTIPAVLAGADGLVNKGAPASELCYAIREVARGERVLPPVSRELLSSASERLAPDELPVLGMVLDGASPAEMAGALGVDLPAISHRLDRMIGRLKVDVAVANVGGLDLTGR